MGLAKAWGYKNPHCANSANPFVAQSFVFWRGRLELKVTSRHVPCEPRAMPEVRNHLLLPASALPRLSASKL
eukprot:4820058-Amphidinium_carterae.1